MKGRKHIQSELKSMDAKSSRGQVVVEYALLLLISIAMFFSISESLVSREKGSEGFIIKKWQNILKIIGEDCAGSSSDNC